MTALPLLAATVLAQAATVDVPFRIGDEAIIVDVEVNGKKASLMFDTGFSGAVVIDNAINIGKPSGYMTLRDFVGEFQAPVVDIKSMKVGNKSIDPTGMQAVQQPARNYSFSYNTHCNGILGLEVMRKYVLEINFERQRFIFHPDSHDISKRTPDNKRTFLNKLLPKGHGSLEMLVEAPTGKKLTLALDTGNAFYATTHKEVLERVGLWKPGQEPRFTKSSYVASGEVASWDIRLQNMNIYGVPVSESVWNIIDLPSSSADHDGTVGFGFLKNFNITIDFNRRRVWLENFTGKTGSEPEGSIGVSAFPNPNNSNRVTIVRIAPASPAEAAGLKVGDVILSIGDVDLINASWRQVMRLLEGEKGTKVKLAISRKGQLMRFEIERDHLVNLPQG